VNDLVFFQEDQALQDLKGVFANLFGRESNKASSLEVLEEIGMKKLKDEAVMVSKVALVEHSYNVVLVVRVLLHYVSEILSFFMGEFVIHLSIPGNLDSKCGLTFATMISALHHLCEGALADDLHDFIAIRKMVANLHSVITLEVVEHRVALVFAVLGVTGRVSSPLLERPDALVVCAP